MKKYMLLLVLVLCMGLFQVAFGQAPKFGVGGIVGIPTGDWSDYENIIFAGTAQVLLPMGGNTAIGAQAGFGIISAKEGGDDINVVPILAQGRYYLGLPGGPRPFAGALVGFHNFSNGESKTKFSFAPMGGVEVGGLDLSAFYMIISDANYFGGRIGFNFGIVE